MFGQIRIYCDTSFVWLQRRHHTQNAYRIIQSYGSINVCVSLCENCASEPTHTNPHRSDRVSMLVVVVA